ncbi:unnamed protein product [Rotaria sordida]|uniref:Iodothyronine deiodinase n=1 Tax=Rotaria sordida TaxID=392033 RepID=A0A819M642_9BILA|nr:unnamed protein product [Rotaria sordida]CAF1146960.1 unnamed protein product [Rotaria sordida]CAF3594479.1 unnamed protein product [Rotaria sordida]CAF3975005.1 unnamed protein product [Rotaria sordida]
MYIYLLLVNSINEFNEIISTAKRMVYNPVRMILNCLWIVITFQENNWIEERKKLAEQDLNKTNDEMPNELIQGTAVTAQTCPPSLIVRSALTLQFWIFYWKLEYRRLQLSKTLPSYLTDVNQTVPNSAKIIPVLTENINVFNNEHFNIETINLRSLIKQGRHLVVNFEAHASDGWKFYDSRFSFIKNHRNIQDRLDAIKILVEKANINTENQISVYADTIDNHTNNLFRAWPEKLYVLHDEKIVYQGQNGPSGYSIPSLDYFLRKNVPVQI